MRPVPQRTRTAFHQAVRAARGLSVLAPLTLVLWLAPSAIALPPTHAREEARDIAGLNHACGAAVDSEGDVYASSAGESKIKVFSEAHTEIGAVTTGLSGAEPCALAVDSSGNLYVTKKATGEVVRYHPTQYPFSAAPSYEAPVTIDSSGSARGISVDPADNRLYVAEGSRVSVYGPDGSLFQVNEEQRVRVGSASTTGGTFTLSFGTATPTTTAPIPFGATPTAVQEALEGLGEIGPGDVEVQPLGIAYLVIFKGALESQDVEPIVADSSGLTPSGDILVSELNKGFDGHVGEGLLVGATGVGAAKLGPNRYVAVAQPGEDDIEVLSGLDVRTLEPLTTIDGSETPAGELGLAAESYLGVDSSNGHLFAYDAKHKLVNELEATGHYFTQISDPALADGGPTQVAIDRSGRAGDGAVYVSSGGSSDAKLLSFGPPVEPSRRALPSLSREFTNACGTAVDSEGDVYVAGIGVEKEGNKVWGIAIYDPSGNQIGSIVDSVHNPCALAVDSKGNVYAVGHETPADPQDESVVMYKPASYPFSGAPSYESPVVIEASAAQLHPIALAVNPANDHLFVSHMQGGGGVREYGSAAAGSPLERSGFCGLGQEEQLAGIAVDGRNGDVYVFDGSASQRALLVCSPDGSKVLSRIDGTGSPAGPFGGGSTPQLAVDETNGHVLVGALARGDIEEYEASGAFVGSVGSFTVQEETAPRSDIALDNSGGPNEGNLYFAYDDPATSTDLSAFGPLSYGELPVVLTGQASGLGVDSASVHGTVNPAGFLLQACRFEYLTDTEYRANIEQAKGEGHPEPAAEGYGFAGAASAACAESPGEIGAGSKPVAVHADLSGIEPQTTRYRYRLVAENVYGVSWGDGLIFGPPVVGAESAQPILYKEATVRAEVDSSGLPTTYRVEYGKTAAYDQVTPAQTLPASKDGPVEVEVPIAGLEEATAYHFRLVAENEAAVREGPDQSFVTQQRHPRLPCPNETLRLENNSSGLPDCRAYELVTPADTRGKPRAPELARFNNWLVTPIGPLAGDSLAFFMNFAALPGDERNGLKEGYRATRGGQGWSSAAFAPSTAEAGERFGAAVERGIASDQLYSFYEFGYEFGVDESTPTALPGGRYLRTQPGDVNPACLPGGAQSSLFELIGCGEEGTDVKALPYYVSAGGTHVIFGSAEHLEPGAPEKGIQAVYDRSAGSLQASVVSLLPGNVAPPSAAAYDGATEDGSSVVFSVNGALYLRRGGTETLKVADAPADFVAVSEGGSRVFFTTNKNNPAKIEAFDAETDSTVTIAEDAKFVNVSADGSHAYYTSEGNLYVWDSNGVKLIAPLDPRDLGVCEGDVCFPGTFEFDHVALDSLALKCVGWFPSQGSEGMGNCPSRTTPDGRYLVFQSHADLTPPYEGKGHSEVYRYDAEDGSLLCVSCDPSGVPATAEADLQNKGEVSSITTETIVPGVTDNGDRVFFQTSAPLLPEDANAVLDVYEWQAEGTGGCDRESGCLALISSGQADTPSAIYSETPDGHDVFISTFEKQVPSDISGSPSIYDARIGGGFPQPVEAQPCQGDACQGEGSLPPTLRVPGEATELTGNLPAGGKRCHKGKRPVRPHRATRCLRNHQGRHHPRKRHRKRGVGP